MRLKALLSLHLNQLEPQHLPPARPPLLLQAYKSSHPLLWASSCTPCTRYQCQWHLVVAVGTVFSQNVECWHCCKSPHPLLYVGILTHCVHQISMSVASGCSRGDCFFYKMLNVGTAASRCTLCCMWASSRTACVRDHCGSKCGLQGMDRRVTSILVSTCNCAGIHV